MFTDNLASIFKKNITVTLSEDGMSASIILASPPLSESYTVNEILQILKAYNVVYGIDMDKLNEMIELRIHNVLTKVAYGTHVTEGKPGYYEYLFNLELDHSPKILPDGSVDYKSLNLIEPVKKGDTVVIYHPAEFGTPGTNVHGITVAAARAKDLPVLKGTGFTISEDKCTYTANLSGKIELVNERLYITNVLIIDGDTDASTGDIHFSGDVIIKGSVTYRYSIFAEGSIIVCGSVEAASLVAGMNVELRNGMQGGGKGSIECLGNVSGKFFEQVKINCKGNLDANSILHCEIHCAGKVTVSGHHGIIVGGAVEALAGISATVLGNISETKTNLIVGSSASLTAELLSCELEIKDLTELSEKTTFAIDKLTKIMLQYPNEQINTKKSELIRQKITLTSNISSKIAEREELLTRQSISQNAAIRVSKYLYPEVRMSVAGLHYMNTNTFHNVSIKCVDGEVKIFSNV